MNHNIGTLSVKVDADTEQATENFKVLQAQLENLNDVRATFYANVIMRLALACGFAATILAVFFAVIYSFLRWVL